MAAIIPLGCAILLGVLYGVTENILGALFYFIILALLFWPVTVACFGQLLVVFRICKRNPYL